MITTPDELYRETMGTISGQCRKMYEAAMSMDAARLDDENRALQKAIALLGVIAKHIKGGERA